MEQLKIKYSEIWNMELEAKISYMLDNGCRKCRYGIEFPDGVSCNSIYRINELSMDEIKEKIIELQ